MIYRLLMRLQRCWDRKVCGSLHSDTDNLVLHVVRRKQAEQ